MPTNPGTCGNGREITLEEVLTAMHPKEPFRLAVFGSGKSFTRLCREMPCSATWLRRVLDDEKFYPPYPRLPRFCAVTGCDLPLRWLQAQKGAEAGSASLEVGELLAGMIAMQAKLGSAGACALEAAEDGKLNAAELRKQLGALTPLICTALELAGRLRNTLFSERRSARSKGV